MSKFLLGQILSQLLRTAHGRGTVAVNNKRSRHAMVKFYIADVCFFTYHDKFDKKKTLYHNYITNNKIRYNVYTYIYTHTCLFISM